MTLGADIPAWGGEWTVSLAYTDAESDDKVGPYTFDAAYKDASIAKVDLKGYAAGVMYTYPLSKQTVIKAGVGYMKAEADVDGWKSTAEYENYNAVIGLLKYF